MKTEITHTLFITILHIWTSSNIETIIIHQRYYLERLTSNTISIKSKNEPRQHANAEHRFKRNPHDAEMFTPECAKVRGTAEHKPLPTPKHHPETRR